MAENASRVPGASEAILGSRIARIADDARRRFGAFVADCVNPGTVERDQRGVECPRELMRGALDIGLFGCALPTELGGEAVDPFHWGLVLEEIGYLCEDGAFPALLSLRVGLTKNLFETAQPHVVRRYVDLMARAELFASFAYSDGADPFAFSSTLSDDGSSLVANGEKPMVAGATNADLFITFLKDERTGDLAVVLIERTDPGVSVSSLDTLGLRSFGLGTLRLQHVRLPRERVLVGSDGISHGQRMLNDRRLLLVTSQVGAMRSLHEHCMRQLSTTLRYGMPLTEMQSVQAALGRQRISIDTCTAMLHTALARLAGYGGSIDPFFDPLISATKHHVSNECVALAISALKLLGGRGYLRGPAERFLRDSCGLLAGGGTQEVLEIDLGIQAITDFERGADRTGRPR